MTVTEPAPPEAQPTPRWTVGKVFAGLFIVGSIGFWAWALGPWAPTGNPDDISSQEFLASAETVCATATAAVAEVPIARVSSSPADRAAQLERTNPIYNQMVADLGALGDELVVDAHESEVLGLWLADWDVYMSDRENFKDRLLEADVESAPLDLAFYVTKVDGGAVTRRLDYFANLNDIPSCSSPVDA